MLEDTSTQSPISAQLKNSAIRLTPKLAETRTVPKALRLSPPNATKLWRNPTSFLADCTTAFAAGHALNLSWNGDHDPGGGKGDDHVVTWDGVNDDVMMSLSLVVARPWSLFISALLEHTGALHARIVLKEHAAQGPQRTVCRAVLAKPTVPKYIWEEPCHT